MELKSIQKIIIVTSGQPSLNPRMVKEADALADAGYEVIVLYAYWNKWGTEHDLTLLAEKKWKASRLGGDPLQKPFIYFLSRIIHKFSKGLLEKTGNFKYLADIAIARSSYFLLKGLKKYTADLFIAHNLGALPAVAKVSAKQNKKFGFDAEDFHRQEADDNVNSFSFKIASYIEDSYLPSADYITASSPLISERYESLYNKKPTTILNVFPKTNLPVFENKNSDKTIKLFWFSQTIGPNRGLETVIEAMGLSSKNLELHLLGHPIAHYKQRVLQLANVRGVSNSNIFFYEPVKAEQIFHLAQQFDIGLACDNNHCLNRDIALTNKIFTYIQSGLAVVANHTTAQKLLMLQSYQTGKIYSNAEELSIILNQYAEDRELLCRTKNESFKLGQQQLNWENESKKFLSVIKETLNKHE